MDFLKLYQHLLPDGRAWRTTVDKRLRQFFAGLSGVAADIKAAADSVWADLLPETTDKLDEWEQQFGLPASAGTEQDRRDRLAATWRALVGGQSPRYIQDTLRENGFDVYVHEWWVPGAFPLSAVFCGEPAAACGEPAAECSGVIVEVRDPFDVLAPDNVTPIVGKGYPLVNIIETVGEDTIVLCGEEGIACGEPAAVANNFFVYLNEQKEYVVPTDPATWPYFLYIGGELFGDIAQVPQERRAEFEALCLKICPNQQWLGILVEYI